MKWTANKLRQFELKVQKLWNQGKLKVPIHLSGGNEDTLIGIYNHLIRPMDYVFSTHRNHLHYLLHGGCPKKLLYNMTTGRMGSMNTTDRSINFFSSAIVGGCTAIAVGVAKALKANKSKKIVWCFIGDAVLDGGHFWEALQYTQGYSLPLKFIIEDNDRSTCTSINDRLGSGFHQLRNYVTSAKHVTGYIYDPKYPHVGSGVYVQF